VSRTVLVRIAIALVQILMSQLDSEIGRKFSIFVLSFPFFSRSDMIDSFCVGEVSLIWIL
jgi:hypothetical protein